MPTIPAFLFKGGGCFFAKRSAESHSRPGKRSAAGEDTSGAIPAFVPDGGFALSGLRHPPVSPYTPGPVLLLCRAAAHALPGIRFVRPAVNLFTIVAETAGADGLKIAETFPEGRGSPHGCGLRAVFCTDAASARPEACRDKSKGPRSGDFAGRSPGVQGAAATGRPLCAPCAMPGITQKINRERNVR